MYNGSIYKGFTHYSYTKPLYAELYTEPYIGLYIEPHTGLYIKLHIGLYIKPLYDYI